MKDFLRFISRTARITCLKSYRDQPPSVREGVRCGDQDTAAYAARPYDSDAQGGLHDGRNACGHLLRRQDGGAVGPGGRDAAPELWRARGLCESGMRQLGQFGSYSLG
jgi:hypothetical protein